MTLIQFEQAVLQTDFILALGNFIDAFSLACDKAKLLSEPSDFKSLNNQQKALFAATCESLCNQFNISIPDWLNNKEFFLLEPFYQFNTQNDEYKKYLKESAPIEFSKRNLYFDSNCIARA